MIPALSTFCVYRRKAVASMKAKRWKWSNAVAPLGTYVPILEEWQDVPAVYVFFRAGVCRYVGATSNLASRLYSSLNERVSAGEVRNPWVAAVARFDTCDAAFRLMREAQAHSRSEVGWRVLGDAWERG